MAIKIGQGTKIQSTSNGRISLLDETGTQSGLVITQKQNAVRPTGNRYEDIQTEVVQADKSVNLNNPPLWQLSTPTPRVVLGVSLAGASTAAAPIENATLLLLKYDTNESSFKTVYQFKLPTISPNVQYDFDLREEGRTPFFLFDADGLNPNYALRLVRDEGTTVDIEIAGNSVGVPFYGVEFAELGEAPLAFVSDTLTDVAGVEFGVAGKLAWDGHGLAQSDRVLGSTSLLVSHDITEERASDQFLNIAGQQNDLPVFTTDTDQLINPSFLFQPGFDALIFDVQIKNVDPITDVVFSIIYEDTSQEVWKANVGTLGANSTVRLDFTDALQGNIPFNSNLNELYRFELSSDSGDVVLLGDSGSGRPWITISYIPVTNRTLAYVDDLEGTDGVYHVDASTTVPSDERDGSIFRPFIDLDECNAAIGDGTVAMQHSIHFASGSYGSSELLAYTTLVNESDDPEAAKFTQLTYSKDQSFSGLRGISCNNLVYDNSISTATTQCVLNFEDGNALGNIILRGRGAGSDRITISDFKAIDDISTCENVELVLREINPTEAFLGNINIFGDSDGVNLKNGYNCIVDIASCNLSGGNSITATGDTGNIYLEVKNSRVPIIATTGNNVTVARDANSASVIIPISGTPEIVNIDRADQISFDNTITGQLVATTPQGAIDELTLRDAGDAPTGDNVVYVRQESDFGDVVGNFRINVTPNTTFILNAPVIQTLPFLIPIGSNMTILSSSMDHNTLTYNNSIDEQFQGNDVGTVYLHRVTLEGLGVAALFFTRQGSIDISNSKINSYARGGTVEDGEYFSIVDSSLELNQSGFEIRNPSYGNVSTNTITTLSGYTGEIFNVFGVRAGAFQINNNLITDNGSSELVRISPEYDVSNTFSITNNNMSSPENMFNVDGIEGTFGNVGNANITLQPISEVQNSMGYARFLHNGIINPVENQTVTLSGYVTNPSYNGTHVITEAGIGFFDINRVPFGSDELTGSYTSTSLTVVEVGTQVNDGDGITISTNGSVEYDGGYIVYNKQVDSFEITKQFGTTKQGTWSSRGLNQTDSRVLATDNPKASRSRYIGGAYVNGNTVVQETIINNVFRDMTFGGAGGGLTESSNLERWKLANTETGEMLCSGREPFDGTINSTFTCQSGGVSQGFRFKWVINRDDGNGWVDLPDPIETLADVGDVSTKVSLTIPLECEYGSRVKPQVTRNSGTDNITNTYATINIVE